MRQPASGLDRGQTPTRNRNILPPAMVGHALLRRSSPYVVGLGGSVLCTAFLRATPWESRLDTTALLYLGVVVAAAFLGGIGPGVATAIGAFVFMDHNFIAPT